MVQTPSKTVTLEEFLNLPETKPASEYSDYDREPLLLAFCGLKATDRSPRRPGAQFLQSDFPD